MKTRATPINPKNRFQSIVTDRECDDGWYQDPADEACPDSLATEVTEEQARSIISRNRSPDIPFDQSINPYRGCEHACIYCFARPTHAYWDMSPGLDFETRLIAKPNAADQLRRELDKPGYRVSPIALGINTDAYQPIEKQREITRDILKVLVEYRHPVSIITKGALILRDLDLLSELAGQGLCTASVSLTTLDNSLKRQMEPRTAAPATRLKIIRELAAAGVPTGIIIGPVIPFINDHEIEAILEAGAGAGAERASWIMLRLPLELDELFQDWLQRHFPQRAEHVMSRIRDLRGGKSYQSRWGERMTGKGPYADLVRQRFNRKARSLGLGGHEAEPMRRDLFRRPGGEQMQLI
ncbi:PA0069 family radical SAM protein [Marinobacter orientalis]|uniref:PA0069 family radical SAM protein n=1 Tax=Marinobacter orientalis TaxID=1928859 RepID=A0A7Y0NJL2_9GAMM|nr:PA0069 family radical SAM protein [Marinobacter orientalis]NMT62388.1 PA0069 family radical SAM protein [Marinobacter orientalis]TGX51091.1 PA0069 family radical SAM protein [Marinobacter orientalis]